MTNCNGKVALVTGGSNGIGRATAIALAQAGARVLVHYDTAIVAAEAVAAEIQAMGGTARAIGEDLSRPDAPFALASRVRGIAGERLDILVCVSAASAGAPGERTSVADFDELIAVNVRAPLFLVQALMPILRERSNIVFASSQAIGFAERGVPHAVTTGASRALVPHLAAALRSQGVRVNGVAALIAGADDRYGDDAPSTGGSAGVLQNSVRGAGPEKVAEVIAFLASEAARSVSGETLLIGGVEALRTDADRPVPSHQFSSSRF